MSHQTRAVGRHNRWQVQKRLFRWSNSWQQHPNVRWNMSVRSLIIRRHCNKVLCPNLPWWYVRFRSDHKNLHRRLFTIFFDIRRQHYKQMHCQMPHSLLCEQYHLLVRFELSRRCWLLRWLSFKNMRQKLSKSRELGQLRRSRFKIMCDQMSLRQLCSKLYAKVCLAMPCKLVCWWIAESVRCWLHCPAWILQRNQQQGLCSIMSHKYRANLQVWC